MPLASIVATEVVPLLQTPPILLLLKWMVEPVQTEFDPLMVPASGEAFTVIG